MAEQNFTAETTVGELRQAYGRHFAEGFEDTDKLGKVLGLAGVATLDEYLARETKKAS